MPKIPKYQQVVDWIHERLRAGELRMGDRLETEAEIAERFSFSRQTIRQALSKLEQEGIVEKIQGSGSYIRGQLPREVRLPLTNSVTIISSYTDSYIFPRILQSMVTTLQKHGYSTRIMFTSNKREVERKILSDLVEHDSRDPLIVEPVASALPNPNLVFYQKLQERGIPIIFFNTYYPNLSIPHVSLDDVAVGKAATEYLLSLGHRKIGGIFKNDDGEGLCRYQGYQEALIQAGLPIEEGQVCWVDTVMLREMLKKDTWILDRLEDCSAVVCYNDEVAYMLTELCGGKGIRIPQDLSIASIDNSRLTELAPVPLTSVHHPMEALGEKTALTLLDMIANPEANPLDFTYEFQPEITVRNSTIPVNRSGEAGQIPAKEPNASEKSNASGQDEDIQRQNSEVESAGKTEQKKK